MFSFGRSPIKTLSPDQVSQKLAAGEIQLVDVREQHEWDQGYIKGAIHVPLSQLPARFAELPTEKPIVFYCLGGGRSGQAVSYCQSKGLPADTHMAGGISAWHAHKLPVHRG
ncbi:rhodanese-like domain-containing protein [Oryzibacter oryziterrae]|uniref:rhodanese-like domain-containing protein n=1 Tax=Oryzibacter oryziterrae TaxID=2766474 RepID=UPI001F34A99E|nr:rhodanese-like domain-containing protein [Oryzibacter oryziterrae]